MQPLQNDLRSPAAKDNSITHTAKAGSNLDAATTMRSAETELQNTIELRATASEFVASKPKNFRRKITSAKMEKQTHFVRDFPSKLYRQLIHQHHLQSHLQCGNDPTVANHNGILSTAHARKTVETPFTMRNRSENGPRMIRAWSENDPTTHETVSQPSHRRGRSSRFGDGLCMEKHRLSCICYLSKTHFVRDFLQNSIGNSSTSTTCNPIYSDGTILELQITMEFHRQLIHQHHLQPHLQCGNDPTVTNHNGILSTTNARNTGDTPFTMRNRSENDPSMIREWSDHTRDRLATVAPQR